MIRNCQSNTDKSWAHFIFTFSCQRTMKQTVKRFRMDRKGNIYFIFFKSSKHGIIFLQALRHYLRDMRNPAKQQSDCESMTFCGTFRKNVARIECATHHERL